eukprot:3699075-Pyramimonas_sp.AAC.1
MGTELGIPKFRVHGGASSLLPSWVKSALGDPDAPKDIEAGAADEPDMGGRLGARRGRGPRAAAPACRLAR